MPRVRKGAARTQARKRILRQARGYYGSLHKSKYKAQDAIIRAGVYQFRDRRRLKRNMRRLWITRLTAACRMRGCRYSQFISGLKQVGILLNRKMLSELAISDPKVFDTICDQAVKSSLASKTGVPQVASNGSAASTKGDVKTGQSTGGDIIEIEGIGPKYREGLAKAGISWIRELREAGRTKSGRATIAEKAGIPEAQSLKWVNMADLLRIKGMDGDQAELLEAAGVDTVKELAHRVPANLTPKLAETNAAKKVAPRVPSEAEVAGWVEQAKTMAPGVEH
jgi:ribosomal protein L20